LFWLKGHELFRKRLLFAIEQRGFKGSVPDNKTLVIDLGDGSTVSVDIEDARKSYLKSGEEVVISNWLDSLLASYNFKDARHIVSYSLSKMTEPEEYDGTWKGRKLTVYVMSDRVLYQPWSFSRKTGSTHAYGQAFSTRHDASAFGAVALEALKSCIENAPYPMFSREWEINAASLLQLSGQSTTKKLENRSQQFFLQEVGELVELQYFPECQSRKYRQKAARHQSWCAFDSVAIGKAVAEMIAYIGYS